MKKIIVFSVLLALLSAAVFAEDGSGWKVGFTGQLARNFFYSTKATGNWERTQTTTPAIPTADGTTTGTFGDFTKGASDMWTWTSPNPWNHDTSRPDNRLIVSISNSGDHYAVYIDAKLDNSWASLGGPTFMDLINGSAADWYFQGDTGAVEGPVVFDGKVGTGRYGGFVPAYEFWNDWIQSGDFNFFGVQRKDAWIISDNISNANINGSPWDAVYAVGATFGGNVRFAIGSTLDNMEKTNSNNPYASSSDVQAAFMLSGKGLGPLSFDVFYAITGGDDNTVLRGTGSWENLFGIYAGLDIVKDLGLSVGYTGQFRAVELSEVQDPGVVSRSLVTYETEYPLWSGVDIKLKFTGIEKMGITFNNNISFAGVTGGPDEKATDKVIYDLDGTNRLVAGKKSVTLAGTTTTTDIKTNTQNWFALNTVLGVDYSLNGNVGVTFALLNLLGVYTTDFDRAVTVSTATTTTTNTTTNKSTKTTDELRAAVSASYSAGNVTFGIGLVLGLETTALEAQSVTKNLTSGNGQTIDYKESTSTVKFGVPIFFKVSI